MRLVEALITENNKNEVFEVHTKFCKSCGSEFPEEVDLCYVCGDTSGQFLIGDIANIISKYYHMTPQELRLLYRKRTKKSSVRMNVQRVAFYLLMKDGFVNTKDVSELREMEQLVQRIWWKRL